MSDRLEAAAHELGQAYPGLEEIVRVDVDDEGALVLTAEGAAGTRWFVREGGGLIERFPERDERLPLSARLRASGDWRVLSYRPGRRMVVAVTRGELTNVLKGHRRSRSARAAVKQGIAEGAMHRGAFRVPRLLEHEAEHEALVFEFLPAREVGLDGSGVPFYRRLGEQLAVFQRDGSAADLELFGPAQELEVLALWQRKAERATGELPRGWAAARERLASSVPRAGAHELGLAHRDLHDRQVHALGAEVALLDFDLLCRADVALDPANLVAHLRWRALQGLASESSARALEQAFLEALGRAREPGFEARLAFYTASALLRLALVYRLRPRWSERAEELIPLAVSALDDLAPIR